MKVDSLSLVSCLPSIKVISDYKTQLSACWSCQLSLIFSYISSNFTVSLRNLIFSTSQLFPSSALCHHGYCILCSPCTSLVIGYFKTVIVSRKKRGKWNNIQQTSLYLKLNMHLLYKKLIIYIYFNIYNVK